MTPAPGWARLCGLGAMLFATPTIVWRVVVGLGPTLGTPESWRADEQLPGSGTGYVIGLSVAELVAACLTVVLFVEGADRVPFTRKRWPRWLVAGVSTLGAVALTAVCVLSILNWGHVDPFRDAVRNTGWTYLCWAFYSAALLWPILLFATIAGYFRSRA